MLKIYGPIRDIPGEPLKLPNRSSIEFSMGSPGLPAWLGDRLRHTLTPPNQALWQLPPNQSLVATIELRNGKHARELVLPREAYAFHTIAIHNNATTPTEVLGTHTAFPAQRFTVMPGESARVEFDPSTRKWSWVHAEYHSKTRADWRRRISSHSIVEFHDGEWVGVFELPYERHDRDRTIIRSNATLDSQIRLDSQGKLRLPLRKGDEYELVYVAEWGRWHAVREPVQKLLFHELQNGRVKDNGARLTRVAVGSVHTSSRELTLPRAVAGARLTVDNDALWEIAIMGGGLRDVARPREQIVFRVNDRGQWERETATIDLLFVIDDNVGEIGGAENARFVMQENLRLTNEALENSGATFRIREHYTLQKGFSYVGVDSTEIAMQLPDREDVRAAMEVLGADGIYYGGTRNINMRLACGYAYTLVSERIFSIATSLRCPDNTLRQMLAYGLGMPKAQAPKPIQVIGYGNELPFYPTPNKLLPDGRIAFNPGQEGYVERMNERAKIVAGFSDR